MISDFPAIVDACVLVQAAVCDTLLRLFERRLFLARWSDELIEETDKLPCSVRCLLKQFSCFCCSQPLQRANGGISVRGQEPDTEGPQLLGYRPQRP
jgi:hypothetical protein